MPVVLRLEGLKFLFFANEGNPREPVHIHVRSGKNEAKFWLLPDVCLAYNRGFDSRALGRIQLIVEQHRDFLAGAWNEYFA
jgi:hypothetical protein